MTEVKRLNYKEREFVANGQNYTILESIPLGRYIHFQKIVPKLTYGVTFAEMYKTLVKAYEKLNNRQFADSAVLLHNMMSGIKDVEDENRHDTALLVCALFIVRDKEDISIIDETLFHAKIKDWAKEGYEINGFFHLALISIEGFRETFSEYIQKNQ